MLRERPIRQYYPAKTIIEDLLTREGPADEESWSPYAGEMSLIAQQFNSAKRSRQWDLDTFLMSVENRDFDPVQLPACDDHGTVVIQSPSTLEETMAGGEEPIQVKRYLTNLLIGAKIDKGSFLNKEELTTHTVTNISDDGDSTVTEADLEIRTDDDEFDSEEYDKALQELPYIIKYLWNTGKSMQVNIFSFIFPYARVVENDAYAVVSSRDFRFAKTIHIGYDGEFKNIFDHVQANKYVDGWYRKAIALFSERADHPVEFQYIDKFLYYLQILGVDYKNEDPEDYNNEWVNSLVCKYLPDNKKYIEENFRDDIEIFTALSPDNILTATKGDLYSASMSSILNDESDEVDQVNRIYLLEEECDLEIRLGCMPYTIVGQTHSRFKEFIDYVMQIYSDNADYSVDMSHISFDRFGITMYDNNYVILPGHQLFKGLNDVVYNAVITNTGYVLAYGDGIDETFYMPLEDAITRLAEVDTGEEEFSTDWLHARDSVAGD